MMIMEQKFISTRSLMSFLMLIVTAVLAFLSISLSTEIQEYKRDYAEINHIRYGLLNADRWKMELSRIISGKIEEFELTTENREALKIRVEALMHQMLDEVNAIMLDEMGRIKRMLVNAFIDLDKLRSNIPVLAENLISELSKPEYRDQLRNYLLARLDEFLADTYNNDQQLEYFRLLQKYDTNDPEQASVQLNQQILVSKNLLLAYTLLIIFLCGLVFLMNYTRKNPVQWNRPVLMLLTITILLVCGISIPMIDIDAHLSRLDFRLMGEDIRFDNQILFFQSKSILDVVWVLIKTSKTEMIFVGLLIFCFSVLFPFAKLICTFLSAVDLQKAGSSGFIRFFTYRSGKWSMADVLVVAIFMAFIGFDGLISDQLSDLNRMEENIQIVAANGTGLQPGFYFFLAFCLMGLLLSEFLHKKSRLGRPG